MLTLNRPLVSLLLAAALAAGCGTTTPLQNGVAAPGTPGGSGVVDELGGGGGTTTGLTPGGTTGGSTGGVGTSGTTGGLAGGTTGATPGGTAGGTTGFGGSTTGVAPGASAPGVTDKAIYIGFIYDRNAGKVNEAAGVGGITSGDSKANTDAVIRDINARGGLGGRRLIPVYANFDSTSTQTLDQQFAAVCEQFTRDKPRVFAVDGAGNESYRDCLTKAGVLMVSSGLPEVGADAFQKYPGLIEQGYPNVDRLASYFLKPLVAQKYFTPWNSANGTPAAAGVVKVGVLTYNDTTFSKAVDQILVPGLKQLGYTPVVQKIAQLRSAGDISSQAAAVKAAQLNFASQQVTHLIPFESNGGLSTLFMPTARTQSYYPRIGVSSAAASQALIDSGAVEPSQYNGAVGFGWLPTLDIPRAMNPANSKYSSESRRYCLAVMKKNGIAFDSGNAEGIALNTCSNLYLLKAALDKRRGAVTLPGTVAAIESLGSSYQRAGGLGQTFGPGRHDPTNKAYYWRYAGGCGCFQYTGALQTVP